MNRLLTCVYVVLFCSLGAILFVTFSGYKSSFSYMSKSHHESEPVIVIGGGLAGLSATIEAVRHDAKVTIIDKEKNLGGNSAKATSGINAVGTAAQSALGIIDDIEKYISDTLSSGDGLSDPGLVSVLAHRSNEAFEFLRSFGLNLTDVVQLGGHSARRTHRFPPTPEGRAVPVGWTIVSTLKKYVENDLKDSVTILTKTKFTGLILEDGVVKGAKYESEDGTVSEILGKVVLTAGGYANDHTDTSLLDKYRPDLASYPTTNGPWATGDVIKVVENTVKLVHMDKVQVHPTGFVDPNDANHHTKFLAPEALRGTGAILLNADGERFANELGRRDYLTEQILQKCERFGGKDGPVVATMLLNQQIIDKFSAPLAGFYIFKKLITDVKTLEGAAEKTGVTLETLKNTITQYSQDATAGKDEFGKTVFPTSFSADDHYYVAFITPSLHYCMGGISIAKDANVQGSSGGIAGLYAAGEVSGGMHGNNRLGGNSLLECVVMGRIAGQTAAHHTQL